MNKRTNTKDFKNYKMNNEVYKLRRQVIDLIYEVKSVYDIPRIDVRIGESKNCNTLGIARLNNNIIWIAEYTINKGIDFLRNVVYHELLHTIYGIEHNENCPLMQSRLNTILTKKQCLDIFGKYVK
jgi:predicted metal-dependent hydrolase